MISCATIACLVVFLTLPLVEPRSHSGRWNYKLDDEEKGPKTWGVNYPYCAGVRQSPININTRDVIYDPCLAPLDFFEYSETTDLDLHLENNDGVTAEMTVSGCNISLRGGGLSGMYRLAQLHFHWGKEGRRGSEHSVNEKFYPLEVHFVHLLSDSKGTIITPIQVAAVGFFIQVGRHNHGYEQLLRYFEQIRHPGDDRHIPTFPLSDLLPVSKRFDYYRYEGSLTTPPCSETVTWSVMIDKLSMSRDQIDRFRTLFDETGQPLVDTFRPTQNTNSRPVYTNNKRYCKDAVDMVSWWTYDVLITAK